MVTTYNCELTGKCDAVAIEPVCIRDSKNYSTHGASDGPPSSYERDKSTLRYADNFGICAVSLMAASAHTTRT